MKAFHQLEPNQRKEVLDLAAVETNLAPAILEKDYWVVWLLSLLFQQEKLETYLTFKGGTSLSKVFDLIQRFSEDVDISIDKAFFGMPAEQTPEKASSRNKRTQALEKLHLACKKYVQTELLNSLKDQIADHLKSDSEWNLTIDPSDLDGQSLLFAYPTTAGTESDYVNKAVKIEIGARSEHWPVSHHAVRSYLKETLKEKMDELETKIRVLNIERTFWEKATILHQYAHIPTEKKLPIRLARHYYDFACLLRPETKDLALQHADLLDKVVRHKSVYFPSAWAKYSLAKKGSLRLTPPKQTEGELARDYRQMRQMFFQDPPPWEDIIQTIRDFEEEFNS